MKLNVANTIVEEVHILDGDLARDEIRVNLLQGASIDNDGSSVTSILEASREAQFELSDAHRHGPFGQVTNKRGAPEEDRALRSDGRGA